VIVVNYRAAELACRALADAERSAGALAVQEIIVDVDSPIEDLRLLRKRRPRAQIVELHENLGFADGCNAGIAQARARHLLLLNSDAFAEGDAVEALVRHLDAHPHVGLLAPTVLNMDGTPQDNVYRRFPNLLTLFVDVCTPLAFLVRGRALDPHHIARRRLTGPQPIAHANGAVIAVRAEAATDTGPLDSRFRLYLEETEWQARMASAGWARAVLPSASCRHIGGASSSGFALASPHYLDSVRRYYRHPRLAIAVVWLASLIALIAARITVTLGGSTRIRELAAGHTQLLRTISHAPSDAQAANAKSADCPVCGGKLEEPSVSSPDRLVGTPGTFAVAPCRECGLGVTLPLVEVEELSAFYPSSYGAHEGELPGLVGRLSALVQRLVFRRLLHTTPFDQLADMPAGRLLDVGCGRGDLAAQFVRRGWSAMGVEPSPHACDVARQRGIDARAGVLAEVGIEPESCDLVIFRHSLEHVLDPVGDLRRARQALRPGGVVIVSVPNFGCWQRRMFGRFWLHLDLPRHRHHFNAAALRATLQAAGFEHVQTSTSYCNPGFPASVQYATFGRCLFPGGWPLRIAMVACAALAPLAWLLEHAVGDGDVLHAIARAGAGQPSPGQRE
jgi:GT2 family glycosyltransferase/SAM-dependent methyltransferase